MTANKELLVGLVGLVVSVLVVGQVPVREAGEWQGEYTANAGGLLPGSATGSGRLFRSSQDSTLTRLRPVLRLPGQRPIMRLGWDRL